MKKFLTIREKTNSEREGKKLTVNGNAVKLKRKTNNATKTSSVVTEQLKASVVKR